MLEVLNKIIFTNNTITRVIIDEPIDIEANSQGFFHVEVLLQ